MIQYIVTCGYQKVIDTLKSCKTPEQFEVAVEMYRRYRWRVLRVNGYDYTYDEIRTENIMNLTRDYKTYTKEYDDLWEIARWCNDISKVYREKRIEIYGK